MKSIDLIGQKFGKLLVIKIDENLRKDFKRPILECRCDCGKSKNTIGYYLTSGRVKSCGCLRKCEHLITHNQSRTRPRLFRIWCLMQQRCNDKNLNYYEDYGGRGITVCERWKNYFNFKNDMGHSYESHVKEFGEKNTSIDRMDNNGNYCKENCKWSTWKEQANNRRQANRRKRDTQHP